MNEVFNSYLVLTYYKYKLFMAFKLDNKTVEYFEKLWLDKVKVFFYGSGCSWTKLSISREFDITDELSEIEVDYSFKVFIEKKDNEKFENCSITMIKVEDDSGHDKGNKYKFIYTSEEVVDRCWCGSSFSFEKKKPKLDLGKLKEFKNKFK